MAHRCWLPAVAAATVLGAAALVGCGPGLQARPPVVVAPEAPAAATPQPPVQAQPQQDPVDQLIKRSQGHFEAGREQLALGHLERAKAAFNRALEVLLESPHGARSDARLREHFDRLVDQISAFEVTALAEGDGFTEKRYEPASIDELLALSTFDRPAPSPELKATVASDLASTSHDIPIPLNAKVLSYVDLFQGRLREWFVEGLSNGAQYLPMIQNVFRAEGLPLDLAYVPLIESAFRPNAVSRAKAKGVWQFMRTTALANGLRHDWYIDERADPEKATLAAARYLRSLCGFFDGDWHLALASYNGGPGTIQKAIKRTRGTDFWSLTARPRYLPRETREYVPMILAAIVIARNPAQYGLSIDPVSPIEFDRVKVPGPVDLRIVAEWTGCSIDEIQDLNPELRRWTTPVRYPDYELKVPKGTAALVQSRLGELGPGDLAAFQWHVVKKGETLTTIANKLRVKRADLAEANYLSVRSTVRPGAKLIVPRAPTTILAARTDRPVPLAESRPLAPADEVLATAPEVSPPDGERLTYRVKPGDTLTSIAQLFRTTVASLKLWNRISGSTIKAGDRLTILGSRASAGRTDR
jgi:membrane-bound lytic murein transglycosylase D